MATFHDLLPEGFELETLRLDVFYAGRGEAPFPGMVHEKIVPYAILAEAVRGKYKVGFSGRSVVTGAGEGWMSPPNVPLRIVHHADSRGRATRYRFLHFSFTLNEGLDVTRFLTLPRSLGGRRYREVASIIEELLKRDTPSMKRSLVWQARRRELAFKVLRILCEMSALAPEAGRLFTVSLRLKPVLQHMAGNLASSLTVPELARIARMSLSGFYGQFTQWIGASPMNHLKNLRLDRVAYLLLTTDLSVGEISDQTGFVNQFHLSREFKRRFKDPPRLYRVRRLKFLNGTKIL